MSAGGPEVQRTASRALEGTPADISRYIETGQHIARARDQETLTVNQLVQVA